VTGRSFYTMDDRALLALGRGLQDRTSSPGFRLSPPAERRASAAARSAVHCMRWLCDAYWAFTLKTPSLTPGSVLHAFRASCWRCQAGT
jgi:hypothetical protein